MKDGDLQPADSTDPPAQRELMEVVQYSCRVEGKACSTSSCSCQNSQISCTLYCICACGDNSFNPFEIRQNEDDLEQEIEIVAADVEVQKRSEQLFDDEWE